MAFFNTDYLRNVLNTDGGIDYTCSASTGITSPATLSSMDTSNYWIPNNAWGRADREGFPDWGRRPNYEVMYAESEETGVLKFWVNLEAEPEPDSELDAQAFDKMFDEE